jgi:hypothetical protein
MQTMKRIIVASPLPDCRSRDGLGVVGTRKRRGAVCGKCYVRMVARQGEVDLSVDVVVGADVDEGHAVGREDDPL